MELSRNSKSTVRHHVFMALLGAEKSGMGKNEIISVDMAQSLHDDANTITDMIAQDYLSKRGAGALWLANQLRHGDWLAQIQEHAWKIQKSK